MLKIFTKTHKPNILNDLFIQYQKGISKILFEPNPNERKKSNLFHEKKYNEAPHAKKVAEYIGTDHNEYYCTTKEAQSIFPTLADIYDEPFGDSSGIPTTLVSQFARKQVTVALSADAGDEIFAGYNRYPRLNTINNILNKTPKLFRNGAAAIIPTIPFKHIPFLKDRAHKFNKLAELMSPRNPHSIAETLSKHYTNRQLSTLIPNFKANVSLYDEIGEINNENDFINTTLALDYKTYMVDDILTKVDRATMSVGLEGREPLLDNRIVEFVAQLPSDLKYKNGSKKYLLKQIAYKYIPKEILDKPKVGFGVPVFEWFKSDLRDYLYYYISKEELSKHNFIDIENAIKIRDEYVAGKNGAETQIWLLMMFQMWWNKWM